MKVANNSGGHCITTNTLLILIQDLNIYVYLLMYFFLLCFASFQHLQIFWKKKKTTWKEVQQKSVRPRSRNFSLSSERYFVNQINMSLNGSHSQENDVKSGSTASVNNRALESEEMEKPDFVSGIEEDNRLIKPSDDEIEKSFRVNQDGSMTVEMKVRLTIKQEEMIHWTTTVSRACVNSQEMAAFSQPVSSYNSPDNKNNNNNRTRESKIDGYESKDENTQTYKAIKFNKEGENHRESATSEASENPKPCFRRRPTPGPRRVGRNETSVENIKKLSQTAVQESTVGAYSYVEHTSEGELLEGYCVVSHSSSSSTRPVPKPRKKNLVEAKHNKTHSSRSGIAAALQLHNKGKEVTETVMQIHQSQDTCENCFAKTWADADDRLVSVSREHKKSGSTESGPRSSSNACDTDLTKLSLSSGPGNARNNELLSLLSGHSDLSQTKSNSASSFTDYENQARCDSSDKGVEISPKKHSENKRVLSKKSEKAPKTERSNKGVFLKSTVRDKKQKGSVPDFLKDLKNGDSPESQSRKESDKHGQKLKKKKKGQSPFRHSNVLRGTSENINLGHTDILRPRIKDKLDVIPPSHSAPFKILTKQRSVNGSITNSPKQSKELSESVSMPVLQSSPCSVHQYVENWLANIHSESALYTDELNLHESRARFQIESDFSDVSETRGELDSDNLVENCAEGSTVKKPVSRPLVQIRCEGEPVETQNLGRFCKSMPSVRMHAAEQEIGTRKNKSSEDLLPKLPDVGSEISPNTQNSRSVMKQVSEQLCLSIQFIRRACSHSHLSSLKKNTKSSSLPDFSSQLTSAFGSPSKALLSFLTVMTLRDGIANSANEDSGSDNANNSSSNPEALQVMQSIQKLASMEDEEELKASLASLRSSTSAQLKKSWSDFQERNYIQESPLLSPRQSEQEFALEVDSEEGYQDKGPVFGITELMDELNMCEDLRREISSLVRGDLTDFDRAKPTKEHPGQENETTNVALKNEDATTKDDLRGLLEEERIYLEEREHQYDYITSTKPADLSKESEEVHLLESSSYKPTLLSKDKAMGESDLVKYVQIEDMSNQKGLVPYITEIADDVKTNQERNVDNEPSNADLCEEKQEMMDNVQMIEEKYTEDEIIQVDEFQVPDYSPSNLEDKVKCRRQESVGCTHSESELLSPTSETEGKNVRSNSEVIDNTVRKRGDWTDSLEGCGIHSKAEDTYFETKEHPKQPDIISETVEAHLPNNDTIQIEEKNATHEDARSEASDFSVDESDPYGNDDNALKEVEINNGHEVTMCSTSECENPADGPHQSSVSDQEDEHSDHYKSAPETEHELQKSEEGSVTEKQAHNANEKDEEADEDEDFAAEPNSPLHLHHEGECSDRSESYKGREAIGELQKSEGDSVSKNATRPAEEKDDETDGHDDEQSNALDTQSHHSFLEDPSSLRRDSCNSEEKHQAQSVDSAGMEEADTAHDCHCAHPTVFPQQLLDFINLALMSSALIFEYDSNGRLRIKPDRCRNRATSSSKSNIDNQYARRCLPSPNTSDLSDYRPDTSDSGGDPSQFSTDILTESGEDDAERPFIYQRTVKQSSENINSLSSFPDSMVNSTMQVPVYCNSSDSIGNSELEQCLAFLAKADSGEGILIDKGRWLLKENHLIRRSPPVPMGMYENVDTTSVDTGQENTSEDASYVPCGRKQSPLAVLSSSELEDMAKPSTPKCTYFTMAHGSDSDPFLDNQSISSNKGIAFSRKSKAVSPLEETSKMSAKKNGSLPSFTSVDFKLATGKVHPADGTAASVVEKSARSQSLRCNTPHEEDSVQGLSLRCGQHCPIL